MTKNKDFKRLVRARMKKTGESYTAARANLVRGSASGKSHAELAGKSEETIRANTGKSWAEWLAHLDALGATKMKHGEIARAASAVPGVSGWWAQTVAVGYERIRGMRDVGQGMDGKFTANKSRTFPVSVAALYAAVAQKKKRDRWLAGVALKVRTAIPKKTMRLTWPDASSVELYFESKGPKKSVLTIQHKKLPTRASVAESKAAWAERFAKLATVLAPS